MIKTYGFRTLFVLSCVALLLLAAIVVGVVSPPATSSQGVQAAQQVTLYNPMPSAIVQMWANPGSGGDAFMDYPNGTRCALLGGPYKYELSDGIHSNYYRLACNGDTGYINVRFVQE